MFDEDIELPGVDAKETKAPRQIEIYDLDIRSDPDPSQGRLGCRDHKSQLVVGP